MKMGLYSRFCCWRFFGALFMTPLMNTLMLSGIGYLFYNNLEYITYKDFFFGNSEVTYPLKID